MILFLREKAEKACNQETVARQRESEEREGFTISVGTSMSMKCRRNSIRSHSLTTQREFDSDDRDLREHLERRAQQAILGENSVQRKLYWTEYNMEIQNLERRSSEHALCESQRELESQRQQLLEDIQWTDQAQRERIYLCSELRMKNRLHQKCYARSCLEIDGLKMRCIREGNIEKQRRLSEIPTSYDIRTFLIKLSFP